MTLSMTNSSSLISRRTDLKAHRHNVTTKHQVRFGSSLHKTGIGLCSRSSLIIPMRRQDLEVYQVLRTESHKRVGACTTSLIQGQPYSAYSSLVIRRCSQEERIDDGQVSPACIYVKRYLLDCHFWHRGSSSLY